MNFSATNIENCAKRTSKAGYPEELLMSAMGQKRTCGALKKA
jgi:hypothetical protein